MESFPAFIPLLGARVIVVGDGEAAEAKARLFDTAPAELVTLSTQAALAEGALKGARLVFVAEADARTARRLAEAARAAGALVNVVDQPALCDFTTPAIVDRGAIVAGIGTGGAAPVLATVLRGELEARWPEGLGGLAELSRRVQAAVRRALPQLPERRAFWRRLMSSAAAEAAMDGRMEEAERLAQSLLEQSDRSTGRVWFLAAPSDPERLTLAALRAFGSADRIVAPADVDPAVLAYARRDAVRETGAAPGQLAAWAAAGECVLRLAAKVDPGEMIAVSEAGVDVELLPGVT